MYRHLIEHWDAVELIARILDKSNAPYKLADLKNRETLTAALVAYSSKPPWRDISLEVFGPEPASLKQFEEGKIPREKMEPAKPSVLYEITKKIRVREPVVLTGKILKRILEFIDDKDYVLNSSHLKSWKPSVKISLFADTAWHLYYYDEQLNEQDEVSKGVTRAVLRFLPFGRVEIENYNSDEEGRIELYKGFYSIHNHRHEYLILELKTDQTLGKDLHILLYIGTQVPKLALGQFHNVQGTIYSGTLIIERVEDAQPSPPAFFDAASQEDLPKLDKAYWRFFSDKRKNVLRVPATILSRAKLVQWMNTKSKQEQWEKGNEGTQQI